MDWRDEPCTDAQRIFLYDHSNMRQEEIRKLNKGRASDIIAQIKREWQKSRETQDPPPAGREKEKE